MFGMIQTICKTKVCILTGYSKYKSCVACMHGSGLIDFGCVCFENKISACSFNLPSLNTKNSEAVATKGCAINCTLPLIIPRLI